MSTISITTAQNIDVEYELGSIGGRLVGGLVDIAVILAYYILLWLVDSLFHLVKFGGFAKVSFFALAIVPVFYSLASEFFFNGQSVGKISQSLKVVSLGGGQPSSGQYIIRWLFRLVDIWLFGFTIGIISIAFTERRQRIGDIIAGTAVIRTKPRVLLHETLYQPVAAGYTASYPEIIGLHDTDLALIKEILLTVQRTGDTMLALETMRKIEGILHIKSRHEPIDFLRVVLMDYNQLAAGL